MDHSGLRNLRDFLLQYNKISESCFMHCVNHLTDRDLSQDECGCVDMCTKKHVRVNHKVMQVYMEVQPQILNRRIEDMNSQQAALEEAKKKELEASEKAALENSPRDNLASGTKALVENKSGSVLSNNEIMTRQRVWF